MLRASSPVQPHIEGRVEFVVIVMVVIAEVLAIVAATRFAPRARRPGANPPIVDVEAL